MRVILFATAALFASPAALACQEGDGHDHSSCTMPAPATEALPAGTTQASFDVKGMTCGACASKVQAALKGVEGVAVANVDLEKNTATVAYDTSKTDTAKMIAAVNALGKFTATVKN
jgi:copper chaperone CopZ